MSELETGIGNMTRKEVIYQLKGLRLGELRTTTRERKALEYAIASLETDEAYNLMYEQPEFCKDCISREQAIKEFCKQTCETPNCRFRDKGVVHASCDEVDVLKRLPSVLPKADSSVLDDNAVNRLSVRDILYANAYELEYPDSSSEYVVNRDEAINYLMELPCVYPKIDNSVLKHIKSEIKVEYDREAQNHDSFDEYSEGRYDAFGFCLRTLDKHMESEDKE